jgi:hypothetical protein
MKKIIILSVCLIFLSGCSLAGVRRGQSIPAVEEKQIEETKNVELDNRSVNCPKGSTILWGSTLEGNSDLYSEVACDNSANEKPEWSDKITITGYNNNLGQPSMAHILDKQADIDGDGIKETLNLIDKGTNHCCSSAEVIRNNKVVFTFNDEYVINDIKPAENNNGFYIDWHNKNQYAEGMCCPSGYIRTHFVMQNGKFIPIEEQTINYIKLP